MTPNPPMTLEELYALRWRRPPRERERGRARVLALLRPRNDNAPPDLIA